MLLTVVFRSIVVPVKAIIMNLLSVAAAYGAVTLVFQKGVGLGLFNAIGFQFKRAEAIEAWLPAVPVLGPVRAVDGLPRVPADAGSARSTTRPGDNTEAVAYGLRTTAGIITGAALIMVAVFAGVRRRAPRAVPADGLRPGGRGVPRRDDRPDAAGPGEHARCSATGTGTCRRWLQWLPKLRVEGGEELEPIIETRPFEVTTPKEEPARR